MSGDGVVVALLVDRLLEFLVTMCHCLLATLLISGVADPDDVVAESDADSLETKCIFRVF